MRPVNSLHNPFINRFNDPVTRRHDEMQCEEYMVWLRERNNSSVTQHHPSLSGVKESTRLGRMFAGLCGLLVLVLSIAAFIRAL